jgi:hypothetical protein
MIKPGDVVKSIFSTTTDKIMLVVGTNISNDQFILFPLTVLFSETDADFGDEESYKFAEYAIGNLKKII